MKFRGYFFHPDLPLSKASDVLALIQHLVLELANNISENDLQVYTIGCKDDRDRAGDGVFFKDHNNDIKSKMRNKDSCSIFRSYVVYILKLD